MGLEAGLNCAASRVHGYHFATNHVFSRLVPISETYQERRRLVGVGDEMMNEHIGGEVLVELKQGLHLPRRNVQSLDRLIVGRRVQIAPIFVERQSRDGSM